MDSAVQQRSSMGRKYLKDIGFPRGEIPQNFCRRDKRWFRWWRERRKYGFDSRETWALYHTFAIWLYERLMRYKEVRIPSTESFMYKGDVFTEGEAIDFILGHLREYLALSDVDVDADIDHIRLASEMWAIVVKRMWW